MAAPITHYVDVTVNLVAGVAAEKFSFGNLMGVFDHSVSANRQDGPYSDVAELVAAGFTLAAEPNVYNWGTAVFSQTNGVDQVLIGREDVGDADWTATMDAVAAEGDDTWYITNTETRVDADVEDVAIWTEAQSTNPKIYIAQTLSAAMLAGTPGNIGETLKDLSLTRSALVYHDSDTEYLDGGWSSIGGGLNLDTPDGVGIWGYKTPVGIDYAALTAAQAAAVYTENANFYGRQLGLNFVSDGTMAVGTPRFIDVTTSLDWIKKRLEEAVLGAFVSTPTKISYTNAGINILRAVEQGVMTQGVSYGHLSPDDPPVIVMPDQSEISSAVKQTRVLTNTISCVLAGAIQKAVITVSVTF